MTRFVRVLAASAFVAALAAPVGAQTASSAPDPRVGLKAGLRDAGVAAHGMELLANMPKPEGFFDPKYPAGEPNPRMPDENEKTDGDKDKNAKEDKDKKDKPRARPTRARSVPPGAA